MTSVEFLDQMLRMLRGQFYQDNDKGFFQQEALLKKALTELAAFLFQRGVSLSQDRYLEILMKIVQGVKEHGDLGKVEYFGRYFLTVVQKHIEHHGDEYYSEGKAQREAAIDAALKGYVATLPNQEDTVADLARLHAMVKVGRKKRGSPKAARSGKQLSLL